MDKTAIAAVVFVTAALCVVGGFAIGLYIPSASNTTATSTDSDYEGTRGDLNWSLFHKTLTIRGNGKIPDYTNLPSSNYGTTAP